VTVRPVLELDDPIAGAQPTTKSPAPGRTKRDVTAPPSPAGRARTHRSGAREASRPQLGGDAPPLGERQGSTRFQVRLRESMSKAVAETEAKIALEQPGLSLNEIREIAVWAILGDPCDAAVKAFVRDLIPDWLEARRRATRSARSLPASGD